MGGPVTRTSASGILIYTGIVLFRSQCVAYESMCFCLQRLLTPYLALPHDDEVLFWLGIQVLDQCERNPGFDVSFALARRAGL
jgi:hypothetical protein